MEVAAAHCRERGSPAAGFGRQGKPDFWIGGERGLKGTLHVAIAADDRRTRSTPSMARRSRPAAGTMARRPAAQYHPNYYGAFVLDPDGWPRSGRRYATHRHDDGTNPGESGAIRRVSLPWAAKTAREHRRRRDVIEKMGVAKLTFLPGGLRAQAVKADPERDAGLIWFITDRRSGKEHEIEAEHDVGLVFIDAGTRPICPSPRAPRSDTITPRPQKSGKAPTTCGGTDRTTQMCACCAYVPSLPNCGTARRAPPYAAFEFVKARITGKKAKSRREPQGDGEDGQS